MAQILAQQIIYWISLIHKLVIIKGGYEIAVWGVSNQRWYDPLSDFYLYIEW